MNARRDSSSEASRGSFGGRLLLTAAVLLGLGATGALVLTEEGRWLKLGIVAALWAALAGAFVAARYRRQVVDQEDVLAERHERYQLELEKEIAARREYELEVAAEARREADEQARDDLAALRQEMFGLRQTLEGLLGGEFLVERYALRAESTRMRSIPDERELKRLPPATAIVHDAQTDLIEPVGKPSTSPKRKVEPLPRRPGSPGGRATPPRPGKPPVVEGRPVHPAEQSDRWFVPDGLGTNPTPAPTPTPAPSPAPAEPRAKGSRRKAQPNKRSAVVSDYVEPVGAPRSGRLPDPAHDRPPTRHAESSGYGPAVPGPDAPGRAENSGVLPAVARADQNGFPTGPEGSGYGSAVGGSRLGQSDNPGPPPGGFAPGPEGFGSGPGGPGSGGPDGFGSAPGGFRSGPEGSGFGQPAGGFGAGPEGSGFGKAAGGFRSGPEGSGFGQPAGGFAAGPEGSGFGRAAGGFAAGPEGSGFGAAAGFGAGPEGSGFGQSAGGFVGGPEGSGFGRAAGGFAAGPEGSGYGAAASGSGADGFGAAGGGFGPGSGFPGPESSGYGSATGGFGPGGPDGLAATSGGFVPADYGSAAGGFGPGGGDLSHTEPPPGGFGAGPGGSGYGPPINRAEASGYGQPVNRADGYGPPGNPADGYGPPAHRAEMSGYGHAVNPADGYRPPGHRAEASGYGQAVNPADGYRPPVNRADGHGQPPAQPPVDGGGRRRRAEGQPTWQESRDAGTPEPASGSHAAGKSVSELLASHGGGRPNTPRRRRRKD
ncbi:hypothetical protein BLA60_26125 [Actinophytocola xinjiangensis]|uniref:DUF6779 domain-containing protein n=1 Tax=Actinophytocola xinjiangensis TaxID=485602 RepID=A0A7Z0WI93_9PSEU|nr:DUF6779 domain-containing protein [Actinophytocola xinjiangensis]OLF07801.1 hypothetical protein BLA60_26125 [Actinophytocola xinjiangensis]